MAKVSAKRQITLPIEQCVVANISAGDEVEIFVERKGVMSIEKKQSEAAKNLPVNVTTHKKTSVQK